MTPHLHTNTHLSVLFSSVQKDAMPKRNAEPLCATCQHSLKWRRTTRQMLLAWNTHPRRQRLEPQVQLTKEEFTTSDPTMIYHATIEAEEGSSETQSFTERVLEISKDAKSAQYVPSQPAQYRDSQVFGKHLVPEWFDNNWKISLLSETSWKINENDRKCIHGFCSMSWRKMPRTSQLNESMGKTHRILCAKRRISRTS